MPIRFHGYQRFLAAQFRGGRAARRGVRIPKPLEVGALFATLPETIMDYLGREAFMTESEKGSAEDREDRRRRAAAYLQSVLAYSAAQNFLAGG